MISHVYIGIGNFERALAFYSALMTPLGHVLRFSEPEKGWAAWKSRDAGRPLIIIGAPYDGGATAPGNGQMIALLAPSRRVVEDCYAAAMAQGGRCEGPPGLRPQYHSDFFGAYFRDPDGNKLCVCCHQPEPAP
jgi:catechol 2,3-dioxygenase-like lactoylglutathione lyase family enzyme